MPPLRRYRGRNSVAVEMLWWAGKVQLKHSIVRVRPATTGVGVGNSSLTFLNCVRSNLSVSVNQIGNGTFGD
jgi:hypothetical protein